MFAAPLVAIVPARRHRAGADPGRLPDVPADRTDRFHRAANRDSGVPDPPDDAAHVLDLHGIGYGFIAFVAIKLLSGRAGDVQPMMYATAALFVSYFWLE